MEKIIYLSDSDSIFCEQLAVDLTGYIVKTFSNGLDLLFAFSENPCQLILTDTEMPIMDGYKLCKEIRKVSDVPIIMISQNNSPQNRILGLELGANDYIGKPINFRELSIKINNIFDKFTPKDDITLTYKDLSLDLNAHTVNIGDTFLFITPKEFDLLSLLLKNQNTAFSREEIIKHVWQYDFNGDTNQVNHLVKRLRKKFKENNAICEIETIWGVGYKIGN